MNYLDTEYQYEFDSAYAPLIPTELLKASLGIAAVQGDCYAIKPTEAAIPSDKDCLAGAPP